VPLFEELVAVEAGVDQDVAVSGADQPHHHGDIELTRGIGARYQLIDGEIGDGRSGRRSWAVLAERR
jgi:hypothetical protein